MNLKRFLLIIGLTGLLFSSNAQNYKLVWEDNFDGYSLDSSKWNIEQKIGIWNTGANHEFQHYKKENVTVGDDGNGNNCMILTAKKEEYNGYHFTSGKVTTKGKFAFRRGKLEASIKIPNLANGLWPAFWTLGYTPTGWPDCGEIDILEMGHQAAIEQNKVNQFIGSHLFWGPYPRDYGKEYIASEDLSTGFYTHTVVWDETKISVYFNNSSTPYFSMGITGDDTEEYRNFQEYIIFNLAVGGSVPGIFDMSKITANFPASMYVDWVKVYQEEDAIDYADLNLPLYGTFGVFEENQSTDMLMDLGYDVFENVTGATTKTDETPKTGSEVLSYNTTTGTPFDIRLTAGHSRNMINYSEGSVQFYLKTNLQTEILLGIADTLGNEAFVTLQSGGSTDIARDNKWHPAHISLSEMKGVDLTAVKEMLIVKGTASSEGHISIDEITYNESNPVIADAYAIYSNNSNITNKFTIDNVNGFLYNWEGTTTFNDVIPAYEGEDVLSFRSSGSAGWWGFGIFSLAPQNFESFAEGYLHLAMRTQATQSFNITIQGANDTSGKIDFVNGNDPYGFERNGEWHQLSIPVSDLVAKGLDLSACGNIFTMAGSAIDNIGVDDIYFSNDSAFIENPMICYGAKLEVTPENPTIKAGRTKKFYANATNQFGNPFDNNVEWFSDGGSINSTGTFTSEVDGVFHVWAVLGELADTTTITVSPTTGIDTFENNFKILFSEEKLSISGLSGNETISVFDLNGRNYFSKKITDSAIEINTTQFPKGLLLIQIRNQKTVQTVKIGNI